MLTSSMLAGVRVKLFGLTDFETVWGLEGTETKVASERKLYRRVTIVVALDSSRGLNPVGGPLVSVVYR